MARKQRHLPQFTKRHYFADDEAHPLIGPRRRAHGIGKHVAPTPAMLKRAGERARLYMHSAARGTGAALHALRRPR